MTDVGVGMLGYAFMGKAHVNAFKKLPYIVYPPPAVPRLVAIAGRDEEAVREAAQRYGFATYYTDWRRLIADPRSEERRVGKECRSRCLPYEEKETERLQC